MKPQIITFALLLAVLSFTSCKNNETTTPETPIAKAATTQVDSINQLPATAVKDYTKSSEKEENEANEKNENK
ncbi:hypothetical protein [Flavobacterium frigoris]|uniref:Lipoprotein n=1 Tax=Flavobacterium frigoris TaxID=229204 RepID=A0A1H9JVU5_FLAFI|nr:hypothetical protein [Flavobacterium frigoris]SEQ90940.1 hypothetical protein SAMN05444355_10574 [Flavobacterium frigoris]